MLSPLPTIRSAYLREQIFTHSSLSARPRNEFEAPQDDPLRDNERLAHIGGQVLGLAVTDLIQSRYPRLQVGPSSKLRDRVQCGRTLAEIAVQYRLHESIRAEDPRLKDVQSLQVDVLKAYVGGLFREQGIDGVKRWLDPLFGPFVDDAYRSSRRDYLLPEPEEPATPSPTPSPPPPPQRVTPAPSHPELSAEARNQANVKGRRRPEETTTRHRPTQYHSLATEAPPGATDRPRAGRMLRGISSRDDRRRDADSSDPSYAGWHSGASPQRRSPATAELSESGARKRPRSRSGDNRLVKRRESGRTPRRDA